MPGRIHRLLFYIAIVTVYGIFFSVESFYNFEGQSDARDIFRYSSFVQTAGTHGPIVAKTTPLRSTSAHIIRLNKRFHQENIPPCPVMPPNTPEYIIPTLLPGTYRPAHLSDPVLVLQPLRGPPAIG
jgi:hypothetical protein